MSREELVSDPKKDGGRWNEGIGKATKIRYGGRAHVFG